MAATARDHMRFRTEARSLRELTHTALLGLDAERAATGDLGLATGGVGNDGLAAGALDDSGGVRERGGAVRDGVGRRQWT
jgi:hypothetical protein